MSSCKGKYSHAYNTVLNKNSKRLHHSDDSGFEFAKEMLGNDPTAAINFDRFMYSPELGFIIMEFLLCEERQKVTPYSSHPRKYWNKNKRKFLSLWRATLSLHGTLYLINYAKKGTMHENEVCVIHVLEMNESGIQKENIRKFTRSEFSKWFRAQNKKCLTASNEILDQDLIYIRNGYYHTDINCRFIRNKADFGTFPKSDLRYLNVIKPCKNCVLHEM